VALAGGVQGIVSTSGKQLPPGKQVPCSRITEAYGGSAVHVADHQNQPTPKGQTLNPLSDVNKCQTQRQPAAEVTFV